MLPRVLDIVVGWRVEALQQTRVATADCQIAATVLGGAARWETCVQWRASCTGIPSQLCSNKGALPPPSSTR